MDLSDRFKVASVLMALTALVSALVEWLFSIDTGRLWFHSFAPYLLFGIYALMGPLVGRFVNVGRGQLRVQTVLLFLFGVLILLVAALLDW
jgi:hypothetical protein